MICWGVPRTFPSGPELSNTRFTAFPTERLRFDFDRERGLEDLIWFLSSLWSGLARLCPAMARFGVRLSVQRLANSEGEQADGPAARRQWSSQWSAIGQAQFDSPRGNLQEYVLFRPVFSGIAPG